MLSHALRRVVLAVTLMWLPLRCVVQQIKVALVGTGDPAPVMNRFGPSTLVEAGGKIFPYDAARRALPGETAEEIVAATRKTYGGPLEVGKDLMIMTIGSDVRVQRATQEDALFY